MSKIKQKDIYDYFKIQIPTILIRDNTLDSTSFVLYAKLIHLYYGKKDKRSKLTIDHTKLKHAIGIKSNQKLKAALNDLHSRDLTYIKIDTFPKVGNIEIELNTYFDGSEESYMFAQLPYVLLDTRIIESIGHMGVRLMYYYQSYINNTKRDWCFPSFETITRETGISENTIAKYNKILAATKMVKITKHKLECTYGYEMDEDSGEENIQFERYNNHYEIQWDRILEFYTEKIKENL